MSTSRFSLAKDEQMLVVCDSASIATSDISEVLSSLKSLSGDVILVSDEHREARNEARGGHDQSSHR